MLKAIKAWLFPPKLNRKIWEVEIPNYDRFINVGSVAFNGVQEPMNGMTYRGSKVLLLRGRNVLVLDANLKPGDTYEIGVYIQDLTTCGFGMQIISGVISEDTHGVP